MHVGKWAILGAVGFLGQSSAYAQELGARSLGAGETGRANSSDPGSLMRNVAAGSLDPRYDVLAGAGFGPDKTFHLHSMALDSRTSRVTMGLRWYRTTDTLALQGDDLPGWKDPADALLDPAEHQGVGLVFAYPLLDRRLSFSISGGYDWKIGERSGNSAGFNFGAGAAGKPLPSLTLAAGFHNMLLNEFDRTPRELDGGIRWAPGDFLGVEVNGAVPVEKSLLWQEARLGAGVEVGIVKLVGLRGGYLLDSGEHNVTAGVSLLSEYAAIDYGLQFALGDELHLWHAIDLRVFFGSVVDRSE
jgi:hypothetical protein